MRLDSELGLTATSLSSASTAKCIRAQDCAIEERLGRLDSEIGLTATSLSSGSGASSSYLDVNTRVMPKSKKLQSKSKLIHSQIS